MGDLITGDICWVLIGAVWVLLGVLGVLETCDLGECLLVLLGVVW